MSPSFRHAFVLLAWFALGVQAALAQTGAPAPEATASATPAPEGTKPPCVTATAELTTSVDSSTAKPGDPFSLRIVDTTQAGGNVPSIPGGSEGRGIVVISQHALRGGKPGELFLEARYVALADGTHVPITIDRQFGNETKRGATANAPSFFGFIPIVGPALGGYNTLHHGKDATLPKGTRFGVVVGDEVASGTCRMLPPPPAPTPVPTRLQKAATPSP